MKSFVWNRLSRDQKASAIRRPSLSRSEELRSKTTQIISETRKGGDTALLKFAKRFDGASLKSVRVLPSEIEAAYKQIEPKNLAAIKEALRRIEIFHRQQLPKPGRKISSKGIVCERRHVPIQRVGLYAPGGTAPLPSTVLMLGIPAKIAKVPTRVLATPPRKDGSIEPHILAAADLVGIKDIFKMGGAQAIAALAYGTESVPKTDKIFGPGNPWVTEAKIQVSADADGAACEFPAGPSEVLVIADKTADPSFVASDLLAQAEHGETSQVVLVSDESGLLSSAMKEVERQRALLPRNPIVSKALSHSLTFLVPDIETAMDLSNQYAPEHLILHVRSPRRWLPKILNAGSVFLGPWTPEAAGDYASGPNHVLPTYGFARAHGGVTVESFMKSMTIQELQPDGLRQIGPTVERLAKLESLDGHGASIRIRLARLEGTR